MTISLLFVAAIFISNLTPVHANTLALAEKCFGGQDEDGNGFTDCLDPVCFSHPLCAQKNDETSDMNKEPELESVIICGDGACHINRGESCAILDINEKTYGQNLCVTDCGYCPPRCGNNYCEHGETTRNCPKDCGDYSGPGAWEPYCGDEACTYNESAESCPFDCIPSYSYCGDNACSGTETSVNCPLDCKLDTESLAKRFPGINEIEELAESITIDVSLDEKERQELAESVDDLKITIGNIDKEFASNMQEKGIVLTASLLKDGKEIYKSLTAIAEELRKEAKKMRDTISGVLSDSSLTRRMGLLPNRKELMAAAKSDDLQKVKSLLPKSLKSTEENIKRLNEIDEKLLKIRDKGVNGKISLILKAWADELSNKKTDTAKGAFKYSAFILKRMEAMGIDPETGGKLIEEDIQRLKERKDALAGITGLLAEEEINSSLEEAEKNIKKPTTDSIISLRGIFRYLASSKNFQDLENMYSSAVSRMRSGMGRMRALVSWGRISPQVEAKNILDAHLTAKLTDTDADTQKEAMQELISGQKIYMYKMMYKLEEDKKEAFEKRMARAEEKLDKATATDDIRMVATEFSLLAMEIEESLRNKQNIFQKMIYRIQDFLGKTS